MTGYDHLLTDLVLTPAGPGSVQPEYARTPLQRAIAGARAVLDDDVTDVRAAFEALHRLAFEAGEAIKPAADAAELAAEADALARKAAPPVPGITQHNGYTVFAVVGAREPGTWFVAAWNDDTGHAVTWTAWGEYDGTLAYTNGAYFDSVRCQRNRNSALLHLADRSGILEIAALLSDPEVDGPAFRADYDAALALLADDEGIARPKVRQALLEAAALGTSKTGRNTTRRGFRITYNQMTRHFSVMHDPSMY